MIGAVDSPLEILVIDDEASICRVLKICLEAKGHNVQTASSSADAMAAAGSRTFDLALLDVRLGNESGLDLVVPFRARFPWMKIVIITAHASVESAVKAMQEGASDYLAKPFSPDQVLHTIDKIRHVASLESRVEELSSHAAKSSFVSAKSLLDSSGDRMKSVLELASSVAATDVTILIRGESGTGKTVLARRIHEISHRAAHPFVVVSCPSLSNELLESELFGHVKGSFTGAHRDYAGRIASAQRGTLFLDEIGEMSPSLQAKMLRFTQDREYESVGDTITKRADVRLITATNVDLEQHVKDGRFREDLMFRLNVIELEMLPLRERQADIITIADALIQELSASYNKKARPLSDSARDLLLEYSWPGNIRELRNVIERCLLLSSGTGPMGPELFPIKISRSTNTNSTAHGTKTPMPVTPPPTATASGESCAPEGLSTLDAVEEQHIRNVLAACPNLEDAARTLGIDQTTLYRRRKRYGII
ncbi:sigma-54-dependent Fis family transcriptional regulator [Candidatus Sumerlaeota bacterium]|nr:sigma-54-dependent Fis family transcriptional regulator [Candidatus Sumerlaeota bacterium]